MQQLGVSLNETHCYITIQIFKFELYRDLCFSKKIVIILIPDYARRLFRRGKTHPRDVLYLLPILQNALNSFPVKHLATSEAIFFGSLGKKRLGNIQV